MSIMVRDKPWDTVAYLDSVSPLVPKIKWLALVSNIFIDSISDKFLNMLDAVRITPL